MTHKIEAIDYLRGFSIFVIIFLHIIFPNSNEPSTFYSSMPNIFLLRDFLNFGIVTIILCSGFSLYLSSRNLQFKFKEIMFFYVKRLKRLILPWWAFLTFGFILYEFLRFLGLGLDRIPISYIIASYLLIGGLPLTWLILNLVILSLLFPMLKYIYEKNSKILVSFIIVLYILSNLVWASNSVNVYESGLLEASIASKLSFAISFILGWSIVYILGFYLEKLYNQHKLMKEELKITFNFILIFILIYIFYKFLSLDTSAYANKYPPSPYYISFGIAMTFIMLNLFFAYKGFIHSHLRKLFAFFSYNSYWIYLWSALILVLSENFLSPLRFINIYLLMALEFIVSCAIASLLIILQKRLIRIEMHLEKHHF